MRVRFSITSAKTKKVVTEDFKFSKEEAGTIYKKFNEWCDQKIFCFGLDCNSPEIESASFAEVPLDELIEEGTVLKLKPEVKEAIKVLMNLDLYSLRFNTTDNGKCEVYSKLFNEVAEFEVESFDIDDNTVRFTDWDYWVPIQLFCIDELGD